jgi:hypothetical protein
MQENNNESHSGNLTPAGREKLSRLMTERWAKKRKAAVDVYVAAYMPLEGTHAVATLSRNKVDGYIVEEGQTITANHIRELAEAEERNALMIHGGEPVYSQCNALLIRLMREYRQRSKNEQEKIERQREAEQRRRIGERIVPTNADGTSALTNVVRYVPDDAVTRRVEFLRRHVPHNKLVLRLSDFVDQIVKSELDELDQNGV